MVFARNTTLTRYVPKRKSPELDLQRRVCSYLNKYYEGVLYHSDYAAGLGLTMNQAAINKSLQSTAGLPDLYIFKHGRINPKTGQPYVALALELKKDGTTVVVKIGQNKGRLTSDPHIRKQAAVLQRLNDDGWYANFAIGYDEAIRIIDWYFERPKPTSLF
jgi:hypothetical protein